MKKIKMDDIDLDVNCGTAMYVDIDVFRFVKDENFPWITVEMDEGEEYRFLEELKQEVAVVNHEELKKIALNWIFDNVEVI